MSLRNGFRATLFTIDERDIIPGTLLADQRTLTRSLFAANSSWEDYYALTELNFDFRTGPLAHKLLVGSDQRVLSMLSRSATAPIASIDVFAPTYGGLIDPIGPGSPRTVSNQSGIFIGAYLQDFVSIITRLGADRSLSLAATLAAARPGASRAVARRGQAPETLTSTARAGSGPRRWCSSSPSLASIWSCRGG